MAVDQVSGSSTQDTLRAVIEPLARLTRGAGSEGEREAAELLAEMFRERGVPVEVDEELFRGENYAKVLLPLAGFGAAASVLAARGRARGLSFVLSAVGIAALVDDVENGWRVWRRLVTKPQKTWNVVAEAGDLDAETTFVVLAHHDAAPTGAMFDQGFQRMLAARFPDIIKKVDTAIPLWWPSAAGPVLGALGALTGRRGLGRAGLVFSALNVAAGLDIARHRIVPGANDNLSAVGALVALAERLRDEPVRGVRVLLASCGAEEVLQGGIYGFVERRLRPLDPSRTFVLNLDTVGSPELFMIEGEGPFWMQEYRDPSWRDRVAAVAERVTGAPLRRGTRARASTDSIVPSRAGYPIATFCSWEPDTKLMSNYHLMTDVPEHLEYGTIERAVDIAEGLVRDLVSGGAA